MWFYLQVRESYCNYCLGVVSHYFLPRWRMFFDALNTSLVTGIPFNQTRTAKRIFKEVEKVFTHDTTVFPTIPQGNKIPHLSFFTVSFVILSFCLSSFLTSLPPYLLFFSVYTSLRHGCFFTRWLSPRLYRQEVCGLDVSLGMGYPDSYLHGFPFERSGWYFILGCLPSYLW